MSGDLAARQAALAAYLVGAGPLPAGFDPDRAATAARSLDAKRAGEMAAAFPALADALGEEFRPLARSWLPGRPRTSPGVQATAFARELAAGRDLPDHVLVELARRLAGGRRWRVRTQVDLGRRVAVVTGTPTRIGNVRLR